VEGNNRLLTRAGRKTQAHGEKGAHRGYPGPSASSGPWLPAVLGALGWTLRNAINMAFRVAARIGSAPLADARGAEHKGPLPVPSKAILSGLQREGQGGGLAVSC